MDTLYVRNGTEFREATSDEIIAQAQALISQRFHTEATPLSNPLLTKAFVRLYVGALDYETFGVMHLNSQSRLIKVENLFRGTLANATVPAREVVRSVLSERTASVVFYHNHPSGIAEPSPADKDITRRLRVALALIDVQVLDHLIVGETVFSFAEAGLL